MKNLGSVTKEASISNLCHIFPRTRATYGANSPTCRRCNTCLPASDLSPLPPRSLGRSLVSPPSVAFPSSDIGGGGADDNDELRRGGVGRWRRQGGRRAERTTATRGRRRPRPRSHKSHSQMRRGCAAMAGNRHY